MHLKYMLRTATIILKKVMLVYIHVCTVERFCFMTFVCMKMAPEALKSPKN